MGRGSNELGRGSKDRSHTKSKSVTERPTDSDLYVALPATKKSKIETRKKWYEICGGVDSWWTGRQMGRKSQKPKREEKREGEKRRKEKEKRKAFAGQENDREREGRAVGPTKRKRRRKRGSVEKKAVEIFGKLGMGAGGLVSFHERRRSGNLMLQKRGCNGEENPSSRKRGGEAIEGRIGFHFEETRNCFSNFQELTMTKSIKALKPLMSCSTAHERDDERQKSIEALMSTHCAAQPPTLKDET